jgi:hypothetical protein
VGPIGNRLQLVVLASRPLAPGVCTKTANTSTSSIASSQRFVRHDDRYPECSCPGRHDPDGLGRVSLSQQDGCTRFGAATSECHRLCGGRRLVEQTGSSYR